jgi:hypothetical protein
VARKVNERKACFHPARIFKNKSTSGLLKSPDLVVGFEVKTSSTVTGSRQTLKKIKKRSRAKLAGV